MNEIYTCENCGFTTDLKLYHGLCTYCLRAYKQGVSDSEESKDGYVSRLQGRIKWQAEIIQKMEKEAKENQETIRIQRNTITRYEENAMGYRKQITFLQWELSAERQKTKDYCMGCTGRSIFWPSKSEIAELQDKAFKEGIKRGQQQCNTIFPTFPYLDYGMCNIPSIDDKAQLIESLNKLIEYQRWQIHDLRIEMERKNTSDQRNFISLENFRLHNKEVEERHNDIRARYNNMVESRDKRIHELKQEIESKDLTLKMNTETILELRAIIASVRDKVSASISYDKPYSFSAQKVYEWAVKAKKDLDEMGKAKYHGTHFVPDL